MLQFFACLAFSKYYSSATNPVDKQANFTTYQSNYHRHIIESNI